MTREHQPATPDTGAAAPGSPQDIPRAEPFTLDGAPVSVRRRDERSRYEIAVDGQVVGFADYVEQGPVVVFPHTVIDPARRGKGLAPELVGAALDDVRASGRTVTPACWYVRQFIDSHPEYQDLVAA